MEQSKIVEAVLEALKDEKVVAAFASSVAKKMIKEKTTPSNLEEEAVKNHVIFGEAGSDTGTYMTNKEVREAVVALENNGDISLRPRIFGKALVSAAKDTKDSSMGRVYLVEAIVEEITEEALEAIQIKATEASKANKEKAPETEAEEETGADLEELREELEDMNKKELKSWIETQELDLKVKGLDAEEIVELIMNHLTNEEEEAEEEEAETLDFDLALTIKAVEDFEDLEAYEEHLEAMSKKGLIKHINKYKMPITTSDKKDEEALVAAIVNFLNEHLPAEEEEVTKEEEDLEKQDLTDLKESKKDKKKDKKKKKEKKDKKKKK